MQLRWLFVIGLVATASMLTGCGKDKPTGPGSTPGTFRATLSDSLQGTLTGPAIWGPALGASSTEIVLGDVATHDTISFLLVHSDPAPIVPGTYPLLVISDTAVFVSPGTVVGTLEVASDAGLMIPFTPTSGSLTITRVTADEIEGNFQFVAVPLFLEAPQAGTTVSGAFDATAGTVPAPFSSRTPGSALRP